MGGYWSNLGNAAEQYEASQSRSPVVRALFQKAAGAGTSSDPGQQLANAIVGRYQRTPGPTGSGVDPAMMDAQPQPMQAPPPPEPGDDHSATDAALNAEQAPTQSNGGGIIGNAIANKIAGSGSGGDPSMAHGGVAGNPMMARVGESGPEMAGHQLVKSPSIVHLEKGDAVVPLTPRSTNKLQPDLLEGHGVAPKVPGMAFSRYKSYGTGRGLMR